MNYIHLKNYLSLISLILLSLTLKSQTIDYNFKKIINVYDTDLVSLKKKIFYTKKDIFYSKNTDIELPKDTSFIRNFLIDEIKSRYSNDNITLKEYKLELLNYANDSPVGLTSHFSYIFSRKKKIYIIYAVIYHDFNNKIIKLNFDRYYYRD